MLQQIAQDAVRSMNLTDACYGTVSEVNPIRIRLDSRLEIPADLIRLLSSVRKQSHDHEFLGGSLVSQTVTVPELKAGDRLLLLKVMGGSMYIVLDKVVD